MELEHTGGPPSTLRILVTTPSSHPQIPQRARKDLGIDVQVSAFDSETVLRRSIDEPMSYDLVQLEYWMVKSVLPTGALQGIPAAELVHADKLLPLFTEGRVGASKVTVRGTAPHTVQYVEHPTSHEFASTKTRFLTLAPTICNSDTLGWRGDVPGLDIRSWGDLLNPALRGKVALANIPSVAIVEAALACEALSVIKYADVGDLTRREIDLTLQVLSDANNAGQFYGLWNSYEQSVAFMTDGPVVLQSLWPPAVSALQAQGMPIRYAPLVEGARGWAGGFGLASHLQGKRRQEALAYINWYQSGWSGALLTRQGYYSAVPETAQRQLTSSEWHYWYSGLPSASEIVDPLGRTVASTGSIRQGGAYEQRMGKIAVWSSRMREQAYLERCWKDFAAGNFQEHSSFGTSIA